MTLPDAVEQFAGDELNDEDFELLAAISALYRDRDPMPRGHADRMVIGVMLAELETELAQMLAADSDVVGARGELAEQARTVTFASDSLTVMITITILNVDTVRIDGWIAPASAMTVDLQTTSGSQRVTSDADGRFVFGEVPTGLAKLVLRADAESAGRAVVTPTIQL